MRKANLAGFVVDRVARDLPGLVVSEVLRRQCRRKPSLQEECELQWLDRSQ